MRCSVGAAAQSRLGRTWESPERSRGGAGRFAAPGCGHRPAVSPSVASLLHRAARAERRRVVAWVLATALTMAGTSVLGPEDVLLPAVLGGAFALWSLRQVWGLTLARRDFLRGDMPARRAWIVLLHDPNPRAYRPLLAIWDDRPAAGERLGKPDSVWRCDDELDLLESHHGGVVVHEAWVDTGPRSWSKPRWVRADQGIAVPHRRALLGRWYVSTTLRKERPEAARPLTLADPHAWPETAEELPLEGSLLVSTAGRVAFLAFATGVVLLLG
jgi:hypothetical protein